MTVHQSAANSVGVRRAVFGLGLKSLLRLGLAPLGRRAAAFHRSLAPASRLEHGLIIILPGIEGCSAINDSIAQGLVAGQLPQAVRIIDWRRSGPWNPLHLTTEQHNRRRARDVALMIREYQQEYPGRPVTLIGHSAGAGIALFVLEAMCPGEKIGTVILLAAAVSRTFHVQQLLDRTSRGIWNYYSSLDLPVIGIGTLLLGTMDRRHTISAGALGFRQAGNDPTPSAIPESLGPRLYQVPYRRDMARFWNFGGHFGWTNAAFVREHIAPLCRY